MNSNYEKLTETEISLRLENLRRELEIGLPNADGILVTSPVSLYYFSGTIPAGLMWIPREGQPVLLVRRGLKRWYDESPLTNICIFRSFSEIPGLCAECGSPLGNRIAVDMQGISWAQAQLLTSRLSEYTFFSGDKIVMRTRMVKTPYEISLMRQCGAIHNHCLREVLPERIHAGMTEYEISETLVHVYLKNGIVPEYRTISGEDALLGTVSVGSSALYPTGFDGPVGTAGFHPSAPFWGSSHNVWHNNQILTVDTLCRLKGYHSDKTVIFWAGNQSIPEIVLQAHNCCLEIQTHAADCLKEGAIPSALWHEAKKIAAHAGFADGFMGVGSEQVRFLGHGIGLVINEPPVLANKFDEPLQDGMCIALEPKIALPGIGMVGVENTYLVRREGCENLSGNEFEEIICIA